MAPTCAKAIDGTPKTNDAWRVLCRTVYIAAQTPRAPPPRAASQRVRSRIRRAPPLARRLSAQIRANPTTFARARTIKASNEETTRLHLDHSSGPAHLDHSSGPAHSPTDALEPRGGSFYRALAGRSRYLVAGCCESLTARDRTKKLQLIELHLANRDSRFSPRPVTCAPTFALLHQKPRTPT